MHTLELCSQLGKSKQENLFCDFTTHFAWIYADRCWLGKGEKTYVIQNHQKNSYTVILAQKLLTDSFLKIHITFIRQAD